MNKLRNDGFYTIYHIKGKKVGCTISVATRKKFYLKHWGYKPRFYVLQLLPLSCGDQIAGDIERMWIDKFGYHRGVHYAKAKQSIVKSARKGGTLGGFVTMSSEKRKAVSTLGGIACAAKGLSGLKQLSFEQRSATSTRLIKEGLAGVKLNELHTCPHCEVQGHLAIMKAWHFDRCSFNPNITASSLKKARSAMAVNTKAVCKHCGVKASLPTLGRWHGDNCKHKSVSKMRRG